MEKNTKLIEAEQRLNKLALELYDLHEGNIENHSPEWKELYKKIMGTPLNDFLMLNYNPNYFKTEANEKLMIAIKNTLQNYTPESGEYVKYLSTAIKITYEREKHKNDEFGKKKKPEILKHLNDYREYILNYRPNISQEELIKQLAQKLGKSEEKIKELLIKERLFRNVGNAVSIFKVDDNNDEISLIDSYDYENEKIDMKPFYKQERISEQEVLSKLQTLEDFCASRNKQVKQRACTVSTWFAFQMVCKYSEEESNALLKDFKFIDSNVLAGCHDYYIENKKFMPEKILAEKFDKGFSNKISYIIKDIKEYSGDSLNI